MYHRSNVSKKVHGMIWTAKAVFGIARIIERFYTESFRGSSIFGCVLIQVPPGH